MQRFSSCQPAGNSAGGHHVIADPRAAQAQSRPEAPTTSAAARSAEVLTAPSTAPCCPRDGRLGHALEPRHAHRTRPEQLAADLRRIRARSALVIAVLGGAFLPRIRLATDGDTDWQDVA